jgi:hypothetical protein
LKLKWPAALRVGALVLSWPIGGAAQPPGVELPEVKLSPWDQSSDGTGMRFVGLSPTAVDAGALPDETAQHAFQYAIDTTALKWANECRCYRYFVVTVRSRKTGRLSQHKFRGVPSGSFEDQHVQVRLTITEGGASDTDDVALPVASAPGLEPKPLVEVSTAQAIESLSLGGITEIPVTVRNPNLLMTVEIPSGIVVATGDGRLWKSAPAFAGTSFPLALGPQRTQVLTLRVEPLVRQAIAASFPPTSADKSHTILYLDVPYTNTIFGGRTGNVRLGVPLRFQPGVLALALWLLCGVVLGSLVPVAAGGRQILRQWPQAAATAFVVGVVLELVGILLVQNKSKFVLLGFDLDPWQTLPVIVLGVANGLLGLKAAERLPGWFKFGGGNDGKP